MKCLICQSDQTYYFSKTYETPPCDEFMKHIGPVDYYRCNNCGFVISKTHCELDNQSWSELNDKCHRYLEDTKNARDNIRENLGNQPPYAEQAMMLAVMRKHELISNNKWLDYAAGPGTLSKILKTYFNINLPIHDSFIQYDTEATRIETPLQGSYNVVINSAMFEHILCREDLDQVNNLVSRNGALVLHTVICDNIPKDPNWFYLKPAVHTAFHTNASMSLLMQQWGYTCSTYCPKSKCWTLFKTNDGIEHKIQQIHRELQSDWLIFKNGFVDYWKGF
jgi:hypothetical protein